MRRSIGVGQHDSRAALGIQVHIVKLSASVTDRRFTRCTGLVGSFGLFGLILLIQPLPETGATAPWTQVGTLMLALYVACLGSFFLWSYRRKWLSRVAFS